MTQLQDLIIETGASPEYLQKILTQDINCMECVLDLIDNSIDAINVDNQGSLVDLQGLPSDYSKYEIRIDLNLTEIVITDNGSGMVSDAIQHRLLRIGEPSHHKYGIGHFGVGLKRALAKLGNEFEVDTYSKDGGHNIRFSASDMSGSQGPIYAHFIENLENVRGTVIKIQGLTDQAKAELLGSSVSLDDALKEIGIRYDLFLKKGLKIFVNNVGAISTCPDVKKMNPVEIQEDSIPLVEGVTAYIRAGMHERYYRVGDPEYDPKVIESLTEEYGWYYVCNDRVVKIATHDVKFGWGKRWHNEYYGFVGWIKFVGDVSKLPWNTKKTDIDPGSLTFLKIKDKLTEYADAYRKQNRNLKKKKVNESDNTIAEGSVVPEGNHVPADSASVNYGGVWQDDPVVQVAEGGAESEYDDVGSEVVNQPNLNLPLITKVGTKIKKSQLVIEKLNDLNSSKLSQLYNSLTTLSVEVHPAILQVGVWSFFESLSRMLFNRPDDSFVATFNSEMSQRWYHQDREKRKTMSVVLDRILAEGNCVKHDAVFVQLDAKHLINAFEVLEDLILKALDKAIEMKNSKSI